MKYTRLSSLFILSVLLFTFSCRKDVKDPSNIIIDPIPLKPDFTEMASTAVSGMVVDENNEPVAFANISIGSRQTQTDGFGFFEFQTVSAPAVGATVTAQKTNYFPAYATIATNTSSNHYLQLKLRASTESIPLDASSGGTVSLPSGGSIEFSANAFKQVSGGDYSGTVSVYGKWLGNTGEGSDQSALLPGDARGLDTDGFQRALQSFAGLVVELKGSGGQALQIVEGKTAKIKLPIATALLDKAPAKLGLWSFNKETGFWKQEGEAIREGNAYVANVSHFSYWEAAIGWPLVNFKATVHNAAGLPLVNVPVVLTPAGQPKNSGYGKFSYTDADGVVQGALFANTAFELELVTACADAVLPHSFTTAAEDLDLGVLVGNQGQSEVAITGAALDCQGEPISEGYLQTYDNAFFHRIPIVNGSFSYNGLVCTNKEISFIAVDLNSKQQSTPQTIQLQSGANALGTINVCGISAVSVIKYTVDDGAEIVLIEPTDTMYAYNLPAQQTSSTAILTLGVDQNQFPDMQIQFDGSDSLGDGHLLREFASIIFANKRAYAPVPIKVNITEYGKAGGFISGSFHGLLLDFDNNTPHNLAVSFRVKRFQ